MRMKTTRLMVALAACILVGSSATVQGADYLQSVTSVDAFEIQGMAQPARTDTVETWMTDDMAAMKTGDGFVYILRADLNVMYFIDHSQKAYMEVPIDFLSKLDDYVAGAVVEDTTAAALSAMESFFAGVQITVTPEDSTKKISQWNTRKYVSTMTTPMGNTVTESWLTTDVDINLDLYRSITNVAMAAIPGFEKLLAEMKKLEGIPVVSLTTMEIAGTQVSTTTDLLASRTEDAPAGIFDVPEGYTKQADQPGMMGR